MKKIKAEDNFIYCQDIHSFVHRFYDAVKENYKDWEKQGRGYIFAQAKAESIIKEMQKEINKLNKCKVEKSKGTGGKDA